MTQTLKHHLKKIWVLRLVVYGKNFFKGALVGCILLLIILVGMFVLFERKYNGRIYPNVYIGDVPFGGQTLQDVQAYWLSQNEPFRTASFELQSEQKIATVSGMLLDLGYDATLSATQAYLIGRSGNFWADVMNRYITKKINLTPMFRYDSDMFNSVLDDFASTIDTPPQDALFTFESDKVVAFKPSYSGKRLDKETSRILFHNSVSSLPRSASRTRVIQLPIEEVKPTITTDNTNTFGIREPIGTGYSEFSGSITSRIHNVVLAASRFNGVLIPPGEVLSFNKSLGDVSAATGFQPAYIIKNGRTILGDGGGVCQVSTTLFRAALAAGLPILERYAHAYRVHYYEEGGFKPGLDATVFDPTNDLRIKNDTQAYILIQTKSDPYNMTLTFELYGASDGRKSEIYNQRVWDISPPPSALYQDDPTLKVGVVKQVDWAAWGAKAAFSYKVTRGNEILQDTEFYSNFKPWQAVYLRGTMP